MRLSSIELRNWKGYKRATLRLPDAADRNVVVIVGNNGAGKTSLLEAVTLALYGRAGLPLIARAARADQPYDQFLERAFNMEARGEVGRASVTLRLEAQGREIAVERVWHFSASGRHRRDEEEIRLYDGPDGDLVRLDQEVDASVAARDWVAAELIPENLAGFFILDGEHLERMAGKAAEEMIREAVDTALGAAALRGLAADLRSYARERRRQVAAGSDTQQSGQDLLEALEAEMRSTSVAVEDITAKLEPLRRERDAVVRKIGALHGESYRSFKTLFEERERRVRERDSTRDELRGLLAGELALSLAGGQLRRRALDRIASDAAIDSRRREEVIQKERLSDFIEALSAIDSEVLAAHRFAIEEAWSRTWTRRENSDTPERRFVHLGESDRHAVTELLMRLSSNQSERVGALAKAVTEQDAGIAEVEREVARQRGLDGDSQALADELSHVQSQIAALEAEHRVHVATLETTQSRVATARAEIDVAAAHAATAMPILGRAARAEVFADLAEQVTAAAMPSALVALSERITSAYVEMAHKSVVKAVSVRPDGRVELLDSAGRDLRQVDASAGESQILALAVMSALATFAPDFPIIIDTPLARLDPMHRANVLRHFAGGGRQLILLMHPGELAQGEETIIANRVAGSIELVGRSAPPAAANG